MLFTDGRPTAGVGYVGTRAPLSARDGWVALPAPSAGAWGLVHTFAVERYMTGSVYTLRIDYISTERGTGPPVLGHVIKFLKR